MIWPLCFLGLALGFFLPGYWFVSGLNVDSRVPAAFIISSVILFEVVLYLGITGVPLTFWPVIAVLAVVSAFAFFFSQKFRSPRAARPKGERLGISEVALMVPPVFATVIFALRAVMQPLSGNDTNFRWSGLAEEMLRTASFGFYPPINSEDFLHFFYPDSIPPMCQFSYFWLYSCLGGFRPSWTALLTMTQFLLVGYFCFRLAERIGGRIAGFFAAATLSTAVLFFWSVLMAQETGLIALAVSGTLYFIVTASEKDGRGGMIVAAFATALGVLSREYGWAFFACGLFAAVVTKVRKDLIVLYGGLVVALAGPWFLRTWFLTGNPFYSNPVGSLFVVNPAIVSLLRHYETVFSLTVEPLQKLAFLKFLLVSKSLLVVPAGLFGLWALRRKVWLHATILICVSIWAVSVRHTAGGLYYSTRVLSPVFVLLAVAAGVFLAKVHQRGPLIKISLVVVIGLVSVTSILQELIVPGHLETVQSDRWYLEGFTPKKSDDLFPDLFSDVPPGSRCLSDWAGAWVALKGGGVEIVPVWNPEAAVLFEQGRSPDEIALALSQQGIDWILMSRMVNLDWLIAESPLYAHLIGTPPVRLSPDGKFALYSLVPG